MQRAIIVYNDASELNKLLKDGWVVINMCHLPPSSSNEPCCLVIVEKSGKVIL